VRIFLALPISNTLKQSLESRIHPLRKQEPKLKWTEPEGWHFTLAFLGEMTQAQSAEVESRCRRVAESFSPFAYMPNRFGFFPPTGAGHVFWLGVNQGEAKLCGLQSAIAGNLRAAGFVLEEREFVPHLTLARTRTGQHFPQAWIAVSTLTAEFKAETAQEIQVMESNLASTGPRYTILARCPFMR
jgi:RNA 2',3'-cyclic 3'-phosphodiesterase